MLILGLEFIYLDRFHKVIWRVLRYHIFPLTRDQFKLGYLLRGKWWVFASFETFETVFCGRARHYEVMLVFHSVTLFVKTELITGGELLVNFLKDLATTWGVELLSNCFSPPSHSSSWSLNPLVFESNCDLRVCPKGRRLLLNATHYLKIQLAVATSVARLQRCLKVHVTSFCDGCLDLVWVKCLLEVELWHNDDRQSLSIGTYLSLDLQNGGSLWEGLVLLCLIWCKLYLWLFKLPHKLNVELGEIFPALHWLIKRASLVLVIQRGKRHWFGELNQFLVLFVNQSKKMWEAHASLLLKMRSNHVCGFLEVLLWPNFAPPLDLGIELSILFCLSGTKHFETRTRLWAFREPHHLCLRSDAHLMAVELLDFSRFNSRVLLVLAELKRLRTSEALEFSSWYHYGWVDPFVVLGELLCIYLGAWVSPLKPCLLGLKCATSRLSVPLNLRSWMEMIKLSLILLL